MDGLAHPDVLHVAKASSSDDRSARAANVDVNITLADMLCMQQTVKPKSDVAELLKGLSQELRMRYAKPAQLKALVKALDTRATKLASLSRSYTKNIKGNPEMVAQVSWVLKRPVLHALQKDELSSKVVAERITAAIRAEQQGATPTSPPPASEPSPPPPPLPPAGPSA